MKRIGILTGGGDAPGLNAVIRAAVKTAINQYGCEVFGIRDGYDGFIDEKGVVPLGLEAVRGILSRGGTILGAANRGNPYARKVIRHGKEITIDVSDEILKGIERLKLDAVLVLGGDGTLRIAHELYLKGAPMIGVLKRLITISAALMLHSGLIPHSILLPKPSTGFIPLPRRIIVSWCLS